MKRAGLLVIIPIMKQALIIQDLSCHASGSLNVSLPVLSALGARVSVLPSTILSSQSDGFDELYSRSLGAECHGIMEVWKHYGFSFDAVSSGYLADEAQLGLVLEARHAFLKEGGLILTDPVMADDGSLYPGLGDGHIALMKQLLPGSSVITPNITEALLLTGRPADKSELTLLEVKELCKELSDLSGGPVVITSLRLSGGQMVNVAYNRKEDPRLFAYDPLPVSYPGSGDLFASLLLGFLLKERPFFVAVKRAGELCSKAVAVTARNNTERREGVDITAALKEAVLEI